MSGAARKRRTTRLVVGIASAALLAVGGAVPSASAATGDDLRATLTGAKERPDPGDPDGRGYAKVSLKWNRICYTLYWRNIGPPTAAHIHVGSADVAGGVVLGLFSVPPPGLEAPVSSVGGCASADPALVSAIRRDPRNYYVNIHNEAYPAGAIRGQLHRPTM